MKTKLLLLVFAILVFITPNLNAQSAIEDPIPSATDAVDCSCVDGTSNLLKNPSFQNSTFDQYWSSTVSGALSSSTDYKACGTKGVVFDHPNGTTAGNYQGLYQEVLVAAVPVGSVISYSAYAGTHGAGQNCSPRIYIKFYNGNTEIVNNVPATYALQFKSITTNVDNTNNVLGLFSVNNITVPANTTRILVGAEIKCDYIKFDATCLTITCKKPGTDGSKNICDTETVDLNTLITGEDAGGVWTKLTGTGTVNGSIFTPAAGTTTCTFKYSFTNQAATCTATSTATVNVKARANAGTDGIYEVCDNALVPINLNDYLTGEQTGGVWTKTVGGAIQPNPFTPATGASTTEYTYTITGTAPCANDDSKVTVKVYHNNITVNAGPDGEVCAAVAGEELENGDLGLTTVKKYQLAGTATGTTLTLWTAYLPGDATMAAVGSFDDPTKLNALFTPPIGKTTVILRLTTNDPAGPCSSKFDELTLTEKACAGILDPCSCNAVTYSANEVMEVKDFIEVDGAGGQIWSVVVNGGGSNPQNGGLPYGTMQGLDPAKLTTTNVDIALGTLLTQVSPGKYRLDFAHDSGKGYTATVRNITLGPTGGQELSVSNYCVITTFTPDINITGTLCENAGDKNLNSFIFDPNPPVVGSVTYTYTVNNGAKIPISTVFNPAGLAGATIKIYATYTPEAGNVVDCVILRDATGNVAVTNCALPVNLINFDGKVINDQVMLNWKISDEKNFSHFEVEHTTSGTEFGSIGKVFANGKNYFNYADNEPEKGDNYYRLKMVDNDGSFNYSKIVNVNFEKNKNFVNVENPSVDGTFTIATNLKNPSFSLLTSNGSKIETNTISNGSNKYVVKPANATAGLYFLNIVSEGKVVTKKVIVR